LGELHHIYSFDALGHKYKVVSSEVKRSKVKVTQDMVKMTEVYTSTAFRGVISSFLEKVTPCLWSCLSYWSGMHSI